MQITIEILDVKSNNMGKWNMIEVAYKDNGQVKGKKVPDFTVKNGGSLLTGAKTGDTLTVDMEKETGKDGKDYWQWKTITAGGSSSPSKTTSSSVPAPRSTYETPEERKQRQDYIIRQSSLSNAISLLKTDKVVPKTEEVLALAEEFVKFVYAKPSADAFAEMTDDIPY